MPGQRETGTVIAVADGAADVRVQSGAACANCSACCHVDKDGVTIEGALNRAGAQVGDRVEVEIPEGADARAGVLVFVLPAAGLLLGYALGAAVATLLGATPDVGGAFGAVLAVAVALVVLRYRGRALPDERFRPVVRAIIARNLPAPSAPEGGSNDTP